MKKSRMIIIILVLIITTIANFIFSYLDSSKRIVNEKESKYPIISEGIYKAVQSEMAKPINMSLAMANNTFLIDVLENEDSYTDGEFLNIISDYLKLLREENNAQTTFLISEASKKYYTYEGFNKIVDVDNDEHDIWYSIFINTRKKYDLDVDVDQVNGNRWTVFVNTRIEDKNGKLLGVCGLGLSMENLQEILKKYESDYNVRINFIDSDGQVIVDTDVINIESAVLHDVKYAKEKDGYTYVNNDGEYVLMRFVEDLNWYLVVHGPKVSINIGDDLPAIVRTGCVLIINILVIMICFIQRKKDTEAA